MMADGDPLDLGSGGGATEKPSLEEESEWLEEGAIGAEEVA
jgi:hypothetical protein